MGHLRMWFYLALAGSGWGFVMWRWLLDDPVGVSVRKGVAYGVGIATLLSVIDSVKQRRASRRESGS